MAAQLYAQMTSQISSIFGGGSYGGQGQYNYVPNSGYGTGYGSYSYPPRSSSFVGPTTYVQQGGAVPQRTASFVRTQSFTGPPAGGTYYQQPASYSAYSGPTTQTASYVPPVRAAPTVQTSSYVPPVSRTYAAPTTQTSSYVPPVSRTYVQGAPRTASFTRTGSFTASYVPPVKTTYSAAAPSATYIAAPSYVPPVSTTTRVASFTSMPTAAYGAPNQFRFTPGASPQSGQPPQQQHGNRHAEPEHAQPYEPMHGYNFEADEEPQRRRRKKGVCPCC